MTDDNEDAGKAVDLLTNEVVKLNDVLRSVGRQPITLPLRTTPIGPFFYELTQLVRDLAVEVTK